MLRTDDELTAEQMAVILELTERGSSELASRFAVFIRDNAAAFDRLQENAAMVALLNVAVGPAVMLFDQFGELRTLVKMPPSWKIGFERWLGQWMFGGGGTSTPPAPRCPF